MKVGQAKWTLIEGWKTLNEIKTENAQLVFLFGDRELLENNDRLEEVKKQFPKANIALISTAGNIQGTNIEDNAIVATSIFFEKTPLEIRKTNLKDHPDSFEAGKELGRRLPAQDLKHVLIFSDGHLANGSNLVKGILSILPENVNVTGGMAGDGTHFKKTAVGLDEIPLPGEVIAIGLYGSSIQLGFGSTGGWDPFGIERKITRSTNNKLYELDGKGALELYKTYLGDLSKDLPGSALLFPLAIRQDKNSPSLVRTILSIDEKDQAMIFAGDIPENGYAQLMKANFDRLIDGAAHAAKQGSDMINQKTELALLISCVGRRIVLDQRTEDELESVKDILGENTVLAGFYSYGEIAPASKNSKSELHNQTMTITTLSEKL